MPFSFKLIKTFNTNLTTDSGMFLGKMDITAEVISAIALIHILADGRATATITSSVNGSDPVQTDIFEFSYSMSSGVGIYEQALSQVLASEKYAGAVAN